MSKKPEQEVEQESIASLVARYMQNPCLPALSEAKMGIREPLAKYIEDGGELGAETRVWLAKFLRGEAPVLKVGNKRTKAQVKADAELLIAIERLQAEFGLTEYAARKKYLEINKDANGDTIKTATRRAKKDPQVWGMILALQRYPPADGE